MDTRFRTWKVRCTCIRHFRLGLWLKEFQIYKLDLVRVQEVRWDRGGTEPAGEYTFFYGQGEWESWMRILGPKRDEVTGGWSKPHSEELHNLYSSPSIIRMIKWRKVKCVGHVARMGRWMQYRIWWESQKKRPLGRPRRRWADNFKMELRHIGWYGLDWFGSG
jgi:hypothetical protein